MSLLSGVTDKIQQNLIDVALGKFRTFLLDEKEKENGIVGIYIHLNSENEIVNTNILKGGKVLQKEEFEKMQKIVLKSFQKNG